MVEVNYWVHDYFRNHEKNTDMYLDNSMLDG